MSASCDGAIRHMPAPYLIALTGPAGCGKSTAARLLGEVSRASVFRRVRFAGPLKDMLRAMGLTETQVDGEEKEVPCDLLCGKTPRQAMQTLGTQWGRDLVGTDLWTRVAMAKVAQLRAAWQSVVIDDCRFDNEAIAVRAAGGHVVYLTGRRDDGVPEHASERGVSYLNITARVSSAGTKEQTARDILRACGVFYPSA